MKRQLEEDGPKAYNALLTLLGDGSAPKKVRAPQKDKVQAPTNENQVDVDDLEGFIEESDIENNEEEESDEIQVEDDNEGDSQDPFEWHFANPQLDDVEPPAAWKSVKRPLAHLGERTVLQLPESNNSMSDYARNSKSKIESIKGLKLKYRLTAPFDRTNPKLSDIQKEFAPPLFNYQDIFMSNRTWESAQDLQNLYVLHLLNHVYKTRDRVLKNNSKLAQDPELEFQDQGFTRPKVLVMLPTRDAAARFVDTLSTISGLHQVENKKRFTDAFKADTESMLNKPDDFQHLFAGNTNDLFCLGIKFTRQAVKLYSSFYTSDLIIGSPLGLRMVVGNEGDKKRDYDFLSSIELLVIDQLDAMYMQSWDNVHHVVSHMNMMPKESHGCDFSRIRPWYLDQKSKLLRQTVMLSDYATPEMYNLFTRQCLNIGGKLKSRPIYKGMMAKLGVKIRQVFTRLPSVAYSQDADERFNHFTTVTLPSLLRGSSHNGTLVVIPNYFDFVRVRNYLEKHNHSFVRLSEYTSQSQVSRGRSYFTDGRAKIMLYSQRLHHYRRYSIKGVNTVVFYGLPDSPLFYQEIVRFLARTVVEQGIDPDMLKVMAVYTKWDSLKLERIVGSSRIGQLVEGSTDIYEFY